MAVAQYLFSGSSARLDFHLNNYTDVTSLASAIRNLAYGGGSTSMADGLRIARTTIFIASNGDRADVPNVIILVTDGRPNSQTAVVNEVRLIKDLGITVVGIGVTTGVSDCIICTLGLYRYIAVLCICNSSYKG